KSFFTAQNCPKIVACCKFITIACVKLHCFFRRPRTMKVIEYLSNTKKTVFSFEILPPLKGKSIQSIYEGIDPLLEFEPAFIDVTYHRQEFVYKKHPNGLLEKV